MVSVVATNGITTLPDVVPVMHRDPSSAKDIPSGFHATRYQMCECVCVGRGNEELMSSKGALRDACARAPQSFLRADRYLPHSPGLPSKLRSESFQIPVQAPLRIPLPRSPQGSSSELSHGIRSLGSPQASLTGFPLRAPLRAP